MILSYCYASASLETGGEAFVDRKGTVDILTGCDVVKSIRLMGGSLNHWTISKMATVAYHTLLIVSMALLLSAT